MAKKPPAQRLGRGLSALLADVDTGDTQPKTTGTSVTEVPIELLQPNPDQPRRTFDGAQLDELTASLATKGVLQPLIVRRDPASDGHYQIVAGERRWRAAQRVPLHSVPVIVREFDDQEVLEVAIIENIQRADLDPIEEALAYRQLIEKFNHTQQAIADALGKSRSHLANILRLLQLPQQVIDLIQAGSLSVGHARALIGREDAVQLANRIVREGLTVRQVEALMRKKVATSSQPKAHREKDADTMALEQDLTAQLGLKVSIEHKAGTENGTLTIRYRTLEDLDGLCQLLSTS